MARPILLLDGVTSDTTGANKSTAGGIFQVVVEGSLGGGNITLDTSHNGTDFQDVYATDGTELIIDASSNYVSNVRLSSGLQIRAVLAGATAPTATVKLI